MPDLRDLQLPPLDDARRFEQLCLALFQRTLNALNAQLIGRSGQDQHGVDLLARRNGSIHDWVGVQCKVRTNGVMTKDDVLDDFKSAKTINPRLSELIFATTARRDARMQELARTLTQSNVEQGLFSVSIVFWDDLRDELSKESNLDLCYRFFEGAMINYENRRIAVARVVRLTLSVTGSSASTYELLLGRTPKPDGKSKEDRQFLDLDYWKGHYFLANLNGRTIDTLPIPAYASDLEQVFLSRRDAQIVCKWINANLSRFEDILYGKEDSYAVDISREEFEGLAFEHSSDDESD